MAVSKKSVVKKATKPVRSQETGKIIRAGKGNPEPRYGNLERQPSPQASEIKALRLEYGLSQTAAAELLMSTLRTYQNWEGGDTPSGRPMHPLFWAYFQQNIEEFAANHVEVAPTPRAVAVKKPAPKFRGVKKSSK